MGFLLGLTLHYFFQKEGGTIKFIAKFCGF
jgi:hypothetical protein